ncbi:MAG: YdbL family protein [Nitrosomonas sp.]|nr:YdbL family protein [Nitrosomonas sp.]MDP1950377.1 YdbL family protein [Nitrosomonas sp.]
MSNPIFRLILLMMFFLVPHVSFAAADIEADTPTITNLKQSMQQRHSQLEAFYTSGAVGFTQDGLIAMHDANAVPLAARQLVNSLIAAENQDRIALYREIARANNHPEWEGEIRSTFSQRWIKLAKSGWWYQESNGSWAQK